jgi:hypothetical protein
MYVFLLVLGAVISVAGIALVASGVSIEDHAFDPATVTPGAVAVIGGLIIIGLGLAVRTLQRIEQTLAARPMPSAPAAIAAAATERSREPSAAALPENIAKAQSQQQAQPMPTVAVLTAAASAPAPFVPPLPVSPASAPPTTAADVTLERFREKFPALVRLENPSAESEVQTLQAPVQLDEQQGRITNGHAAGGANDPKPVTAMPRAQADVRPILPPERRKASMLEALWPTGPRSGRQAQTAVAQNPVPVADQPEPLVEPQPVVQLTAIPQQASAAVSILKSGVVDGMAYTLYSDGSIEAQLPQGTLRFGSITELRNHIEQSA